MISAEMLDHDIFDPRHLDDVDTYYQIESRMKEAGFPLPHGISIEDEEKARMLYYDYFRWLGGTAKIYLEDPSNFVSSWNFIEHHPITWYQPRPETQPNDWQTGSGVSKLWIHVTTSEDGATLVMMEAGPTVTGTPYTSHDHYLDVYASTYEEAIIKMAENINKYYRIDGTSTYVYEN